MPSVDLPVEELDNYVSETTPPPDLGAFWKATIDEALAAPLELRLTQSSPSLKGVTTHSYKLAGFGTGPITGWYLRPEGTGPFPGVVVYHGYSQFGTRILNPNGFDLYTLAAQGVAVMSMDCRGQAGNSPGLLGSAGHGPGWLTEGLERPETHYYRTVYSDAVRVAEALCGLDEIDTARVAFTGGSQGGGLAIAAAALSRRPCFAWANFPFLCDFPRAVKVATNGPYLEIPRLLQKRPDLEDQAFITLSYVDVANLAPSVDCPVVVTAGLCDDVTPPSTIFGMFRRLGSDDKRLWVHRFHGHEIPYATLEAQLLTMLSRLDVGHHEQVGPFARQPR